MAEEAKPTNTPEYGCFSDLAEQQSATAEAPKTSTKTAKADDVAPVADVKE